MKKILQRILKVTGYYFIKSKWRNKRTISQWKKEDMVRKENIRKQIDSINGRILPPICESENLTVSLTSHGKRVNDFAPYAIFSILEQTLKPNRIILNIDSAYWSEAELPYVLVKLSEAGLEINLCEDMGPHTKFLPTLQKYPNDVIITIDDDIIYGKDTIEALWNEYLSSDKHTIFCHEGLEIQRDEEGKLMPYSQWRSIRADFDGKPHVGIYSPLGFRGVLYPPHIFSNEIFNADVYKKLCSKADDIWFTVMEIRDKIAVKSISYKGCVCCDVDRENEFISTNSDALHFENVGQGRNDLQLLALKSHYNI